MDASNRKWWTLEELQDTRRAVCQFVFDVEAEESFTVRVEVDFSTVLRT